MGGNLENLDNFWTVQEQLDVFETHFGGRGTQ